MLPTRILGMTMNGTGISFSVRNQSSGLQSDLESNRPRPIDTSTGPALLPVMSGWSEAESDEYDELDCPSELSSSCLARSKQPSDDATATQAQLRQRKPTVRLNLAFARQSSVSLTDISPTSTSTAFQPTRSNPNLSAFGEARGPGLALRRLSSIITSRLRPSESDDTAIQQDSMLARTLKSSGRQLALSLVSTTSPQLVQSPLVSMRLPRVEEPPKKPLRHPPQMAHSLKMCDERIIRLDNDDLETFTRLDHTVCRCCRARIKSSSRASKIESLRSDCRISRTFNVKRQPIRLMVQRPKLDKQQFSVKKRQVYVCVIFLKIGEIDTIKEQYAADVLIKSKWREPDMDHQNDRLEYDWSHSWTPKLYIENTVGEAREQVYQMITFNEFGHAFLVEKRRVSGIFLENLELDHFPFDVQDLTITVASNLSTAEIRLVNDPDEPHRINKQSFVDEQEWYLYKHIETEQHELAHEYAEPGSVRPALSVKCRAARRPAYFLWNIFLVTFLICSLSLVTFAVAKEYPQNRLQLTFTLVLTLVAFKFVVNQCLPKISYLTYLDKYVISSLFFLTLICIWHGLIVVIYQLCEYWGYKLPDRLEYYIIACISLAYLSYNVGFGLMIYFVACKRRRIMKHRDMEYVEKIKCQMKTKSVRTLKLTQQAHQIHEVKENGTSTFI